MPKTTKRAKGSSSSGKSKRKPTKKRATSKGVTKSVRRRRTFNSSKHMHNKRGALVSKAKHNLALKRKTAHLPLRTACWFVTVNIKKVREAKKTNFVLAPKRDSDKGKKIRKLYLEMKNVIGDDRLRRATTYKDMQSLVKRAGDGKLDVESLRDYILKKYGK